MFVANVSPGYGFYWTIGSSGSGNYFADVRTPDGFSRLQHHHEKQKNVC